ncbi:NAD(P)H-dependent glycerol-3-phosphate dehydrogenase [Prosthecochloris sp. N3]|uniref:Glycerol-3-phosphate dehydrogenase [NAD(P)+] n=1 Tax=Prosthecochloris ethylica TaxID=2743976 RepID=A0ABR9XTB5_9CHLB|nr:MULTISPECIES: NAD(P)H-dependent glycerol-3-phosphate dehydrogenase [Prosthecochloris]MEC9486001.1 NAD(P)H-dependent glycerol-3-phosphate dehydrogenase [Prosthecochloris sp.]MBF0587218.1 NAD(P)H-dependent glycerol-3-phosphate dehydrogenase [Prosthecochloris ethylica]MBF0637291.1 NAD(P)H-dependent glycerol-3-phosphate dehydrogenase [Prosthecochloris ethylica]NUK48380.1 NAD(P)H-dependent glycerol-3-phosphate dehydrogenase [Prosthecochloris ethylica]RNA65614.1 NAD(P)H-dependent glycerol-3-phosp
MKIAVLGAGSWGTTLAVLLAEKGYTVSLWAHRSRFARELSAKRENSRYLPGVRFPSSLAVESEIRDAVCSAAMVVVAVPSQAVRETMLQLTGVDLHGKVIVNVAKGIELETGKRLSQVILEALPSLDASQVAVLYGPSHAEEVSRHQPTTVVAASSSRATALHVQDVFLTRMFRVYANTDIVGVEVAGSVKNIIAIAAGIADGIGYGDNAKAAIITRGLAEISRLSAAMGGDAMTVSGLSGIGDLVVTCLSQHSRNRYVGEQIGKGRSLEEVTGEMSMIAEGVLTTRAVVRLSSRLGVEMPITETVHAMLFDNKPVEEAILDLMTREPKEE